MAEEQLCADDDLPESEDTPAADAEEDPGPLIGLTYQNDNTTIERVLNALRESPV